MAFKVHITGNRFLIDDLSNDIRYEGLAKEVLARTKTPTSTEFGFTNVNNWSSNNTIDFVEIDLTGAPYTDYATFVTWLDTELGKSSPQVGGGFENRIVVNQSNVSTTLGGVIDSSKEYFIDGIINMTGVTVTVPLGGINLTGYNFDLSMLVSNDDNYTMFVSDVGGSGNILPKDIGITASGLNSKVFDLLGANGDEAFEFSRVNFNGCTSLGVIDTYRQGFEQGTGRFGGTPELELKGTWVGGYFIESSIVRGLSDGSYSLFKSGEEFSMRSRFRSNQNIDLPLSASFFDFSPSNFTNPSTVQITEAIVTRNGVFNPLDSNITPNMNETDLSSNWSNNNGMPNTFEGGSIGVTNELSTTINTVGTFETLVAASWTAIDLQHFDNPIGNQLRQLGNTPREYKVVASFTLDSTANNVLTLRVRRWDDSASSFVTVLDQNRQVNSLVGGRDVAFFEININTELDQNDYIELQVANQSSTSNITAEVDGYYIIEER